MRNKLHRWANCIATNLDEKYNRQILKYQSDYTKSEFNYEPRIAVHSDPHGLQIMSIETPYSGKAETHVVSELVQ